MLRHGHTYLQKKPNKRALIDLDNGKRIDCLISEAEESRIKVGTRLYLGKTMSDNRYVILQIMP